MWLREGPGGGGREIISHLYNCMTTADAGGGIELSQSLNRSTAVLLLLLAPLP